MFIGLPAEIALGLYQNLEEAALRQAELKENGIECAICGEVHLPDETVQGLCSTCAMSVAFEVINGEVENAMAILKQKHQFPTEPVGTFDCDIFYNR